MITYDDKVQLTPNANPAINQWRAIDANEVKTEVNAAITSIAAKVPTSRILTIDGVSFDLSSDRTWTTSGGVDKFPSTYNVLNYGLVGDGATNNNTAIDTLIALAPEYSTIYFPVGEYNFNAVVTIGKVLNFVGDGIGATRLTMTVGNANFLSFTTGSAMLGINISSMLLFCSAASPSAGAGIRISKGQIMRLTDVYVYGFYKEIELLDCFGWSLTRVFVVAPVEYGLTINNSTAGFYDIGDHSIIDCHFFPDLRTPTGMIYHRNSGGLKMVNCKFNHGSPFRAPVHYFYDGNQTTPDIQITNCSFENFDGYAIRIQAATIGQTKNIVITGNHFNLGGSTSIGVALNKIQYGAITGNVFRGNGAGTTKAIDITDSEGITSFNQYSGYGSNFTLNGSNTNVIDLSAPATSSLPGYLSATDWTTFSGAGIVTVTGTDTLDSGDYNKTILCSGTSADYAIALPTAVGITGTWFDFVGVAGLTKIVTVNANGTETINGLTVDRPFTGRGGFKIVSDGANWQVVSEKPSWIVYVPGTFTGVSGTPGGTIKYSLMGKQMTINYNIASTAASGTGLTFTIPSGYSIVTDSSQYAQVMSNSVFVSTGLAVVGPAAPTVVTLFLTGAGGAISASGNKAAIGIVVFEIQ